MAFISSLPPTRCAGHAAAAGCVSKAWHNTSLCVRQHNVAVYGAILLNPALDKCLMVKGWKSGASWGFPKGKVRRATRMSSFLPAPVQDNNACR